MRQIHSLWKEAFLGLLSLSLLAIPGGGCGGGTSGGGTAGSTTFEGTVAGNGGETGTVTVTVETTVAALNVSITSKAKAQTSGDVNATGECIIVGDPPIPLSGTFTPSTGAMDLSSSDGTTNFTGTIGSGEMSGTFTGPGGLSGGFSGLNASDSTVTTYCGTFSGGDSGVFNVQVDSSGNLSGSAIPTSDTGGSPVSLSGTVTGNSITGESSEGNSFSGTIAGNDVSGTFEVTGGGTGTFSGSAGACE